MDGRFECCRYEPSLEDLLADEVMTPVLRSAGLEAEEFREMMVETARRIENRARRKRRRARLAEATLSFEQLQLYPHAQAGPVIVEHDTRRRDAARWRGRGSAQGRCRASCGSVRGGQSGRARFPDRLRECRGRGRPLRAPPVRAARRR